MDTKYSEQLTQAGLSYPSEVPVFLQKAKQAEQQMKRYNELSEMLTPLFPEELTKEIICKTAPTERKAIPTPARRKEASENRQRLQLQVEELQRDGTWTNFINKLAGKKQNYRNYWRNGST